MNSEFADYNFKAALNNDYYQILKNIAKNIRILRKKKGMSQHDLSIKADVNRVYIGYVENCHHNVSVRVLCDLAKALEVEVQDLISHP